VIITVRSKLSLNLRNMFIFYSSIYPTRCNVAQFILSGNCSTCFGWYFHPSLGAQTTADAGEIFGPGSSQTQSGIEFTILEQGCTYYVLV